MPTALQANPLSDRSRVLSTAVVEAARRLGLGSTDLNALIGTSQPSASRLLNGKYFIPEGSKTWELLRGSRVPALLLRSLPDLIAVTEENLRAGPRT